MATIRHARGAALAEPPGHIDPDLFDIFVRQKVYQRYAEMFLDPDQIDVVDESKIPGYRPEH